MEGCEMRKGGGDDERKKKSIGRWRSENERDRKNKINYFWKRIWDK